MTPKLKSSTNKKNLLSYKHDNAEELRVIADKSIGETETLLELNESLLCRN